MHSIEDGKEVPYYEFEGLVSKWKDKDGNDKSRDYGKVIVDAVKYQRKQLHYKSLQNQIADAKAQGEAETKKPAASTKGKKKSTPKKDKEEPAR